MSGDVILGAGVAGLAAAYAARGRGVQPVIYEASATAGGLLDSFQLDGWWFDNGVHLSFASEPEVRAVFDRVKYLEHEAISYNWDRDTWLRHPVQNNMYPLPTDVKTDLIVDLIGRPSIDVVTYRDWLLFQYGTKIAERWPLAYTRKYWTIDAGEMGIGWIGNRMRRADFREVIFGAMTPDPPNTYYISRMRYPEQGGYRAFIKPLLEDADIRAGYRATRVDHRRRTIHFANGEQAGYERLISTVPLPVLIELLEDVPAEIRDAAATLFATRMDIVSIGFKRADISPSLWFYIYDEDILASRAYSPSWKSPHNAPPGCASLQFEIYSSVRQPQTQTPSEMIENCLYALEKMKLATRADIAFTHHKHVPYANVVFDLGMEARRDLVRAWVAAQGILVAGRFGEWDYLWSNQSFMSGRRAGLHLADEAQAA